MPIVSLSIPQDPASSLLFLLPCLFFLFFLEKARSFGLKNIAYFRFGWLFSPGMISCFFYSILCFKVLSMLYRAIVCPMRYSLGEHITIYFLSEDIFFFSCTPQLPYPFLFFFKALSTTWHCTPVMVNFIYQLDWVKSTQIAGKTLFPGMSMRVSPKDSSICINRSSKEDHSHPCRWASSNPLGASIEQIKQRKGEFSWAETISFFYPWTS